MRRPLTFLVAILLAALCTLAAASAAEKPIAAAQIFEKRTLGKSIGGRPIHAEVYGNGPDVLLIVATIHGNESSGTPLVAAFGQWLLKHPAELAGHTVVIVPVANPDGLATRERFNAHHVDLNRNFPATNWADKSVPNSSRAARGLTLQPGQTPLSEPESRVLMQLICHHFPHRVISIHQPLACIDYDGPAEPLARAMAAQCPLPVRQLGSRSGSLGSFIGATLNRPIVTLELPKDAGQDQDQLWETYGEALIAALRFEDKATTDNWGLSPSTYRGSGRPLLSPPPASAHPFATLPPAEADKHSSPQRFPPAKATVQSLFFLLHRRSNHPMDVLSHVKILPQRGYFLLLYVLRLLIH